ncbi:MAG: acetolactate synthase small subunit [Spirochaetaceae bacterium]|nr:acetolactate synthase small subunit [Spirochaetaceae bacterium]
MENKEELQRFTLSLLVNNHAGVLQRVVGLFSRRGYNIVTLSVGETQNSLISRMTIVVLGNQAIVKQIKNQVEKLVDVLRARILEDKPSIESELLLVKLSTVNNHRSSVIELGELFKAKVKDVTHTTLTFEIVGTVQKIESFLTLAIEYGIVEIARTGIAALERGPIALKDAPYEEV